VKTTKRKGDVYEELNYRIIYC